MDLTEKFEETAKRIEAYRELVKAEPNKTEAHFELAQLLKQTGNYRDAYPHAAEAWEQWAGAQHPRSLEALGLLNELQSQLPRKSPPVFDGGGSSSGNGGSARKTPEKGMGFA